MFDCEINEKLAEQLPFETREAYFTRANMPPHWLDAILENQESYRRRQKSLALNFRGLPTTMTTEFAWSIEKQVQLGMRIQAQTTTRLARHIALVIAEPRYARLVSLLDLPRDEWMCAIRKVRARRGNTLAPGTTDTLGAVLGRTLDLLVHVHHKGDWWELDVWNPPLDARIPMREHEPLRHAVIHFGHLRTPWLREAAKWWLSRQLEREVYTWSTAHTRHKNLIWFQRYLDVKGCDGPHILDDQRQLGQWVQGFRQWLGRQKTVTGPNKGGTLSATQRRAALTAPEQLHRLLFQEQHAAVRALKDPAGYVWNPSMQCCSALGRSLPVEGRRLPRLFSVTQ